MTLYLLFAYDTGNAEGGFNDCEGVFTSLARAKEAGMCIPTADAENVEIVAVSKTGGRDVCFRLGSQWQAITYDPVIDGDIPPVQLPGGAFDTDEGGS